MSKLSEIIKDAKGSNLLIPKFTPLHEQRAAGPNFNYYPNPNDYYMKTAQAQAQAAENSAAAEIVPAPGADAEQAQAHPVYYYTPTTVKPRFGLVHVFLLVGSIYLLKKIFKG